MTNSADLFKKIIMEAYTSWNCGVCHEGLETRIAAERHCSELVDREMGPMEGRIPVIVKERKKPFYPDRATFADPKWKVTA